MKRATSAILAGLVAATVAGCSPGGAVTRPQAGATASVTAARPSDNPLPVSQAKHLPSGVFYFLSGRRMSEANLWEITSKGLEKQLTHNPLGFEIDNFAASRAGIILADAQYGADQLARWTSKGPIWLRVPGHPKAVINGQAPDIRPDGQLVYLLPPTGKEGYFTIKTQPSFSGMAKTIYRQRTDPGSPFFGPHGQVAILGPSDPLPPGEVRPNALIISGDGRTHQINTGISKQGYPQLWGQHAPGLVIPPMTGPAKVFMAGAGKETVPRGWQPFSWDPHGKQLLVLSGGVLGLWSPQNPDLVRRVATITPGMQIFQVSWLSNPAPI